NLAGMPDWARHNSFGAQRNRSPVRAVKPSRTTRPPREPACKMPDLVEVALQVREPIGAFGFGDAFFPRQTRCAEGHDASLDGLRSVPTISLAEFKQAHVA